MFGRFLFATLLAAGLAYAQGGMGGDPGDATMNGGTGRGGRGGRTGMGDQMGMRPQRKASKLEMFADRLKLTKEQKPEVESILNDAAKQAAPFRDQLLKDRQNMVGAILQGKPGDLDPVMKSYADVEAKVTSIEAQAFAKICAMLNNHQKSKAASAFELLDDVFETPQRAGMHDESAHREGRGR